MKYKVTGIEWLGKIPEHWEPTTIKNHFYVVPSNVDKKIKDNEIPVELCNYVDVYYNDFIDLSVPFMEATANENEVRKFQLKEKDVLITKDSEDPLDIGVPALINQVKDKLLCGYHLSRLRAKSNKMTGDYLFWLLRDTSIASQLWREATGVTRWAIASRHVKNAIIPLPTKQEQIAIVNYLDKACKRIDQIIEVKEEQIKKIDKHLSSKTFELLTGKNHKSKETNYPWFKTIPVNWKIMRLKSIVPKVNSGVTPKGGAASYLEEGIPLIRSQNIKLNKLDLSDVVFISEATHNKMKNSKVKNGDVLLNITGASLGRSYFVEGIEEANVNQHVCILRPNHDFVETKYLYYLIKSQIGQSQIFSGFKGSGREGLNFEAIKGFRFPLPKKEEQIKIISILDKLSNLITDEKNTIKAQIKTLKDYRKNLIHECVTGKKLVVKAMETIKN